MIITNVTYFYLIFFQDMIKIFIRYVLNIGLTNDL